MFKETEQGETQYCPMCLEWSEKYKRLQAENYELKESLKVFQSSDIKKVLTLYRTGEIERIEQENERLKEEIDKLGIKHENYCNTLYWDMKNQYDRYKVALEEIRENCVEMLATIEEEGKPNKSIVDTIWCKNIPCCTLYELIENTQRKINEVLNERN